MHILRDAMLIFKRKKLIEIVGVPQTNWIARSKSSKKHTNFIQNHEWVSVLFFLRCFFCYGNLMLNALFLHFMPIFRHLISFYACAICLRKSSETTAEKNMKRYFDFETRTKKFKPINPYEFLWLVWRWAAKETNKTDTDISYHFQRKLTVTTANNFCYLIFWNSNFEIN